MEWGEYIEYIVKSRLYIVEYIVKLFFNFIFFKRIQALEYSILLLFYLEYNIGYIVEYIVEYIVDYGVYGEYGRRTINIVLLYIVKYE